MSYQMLNNNNNNSDCTICLENIKDKYKTRCQHEFCKPCIKKWVKKNNCCPLCRLKNVIPECRLCKEEKDINKKRFCKTCQYRYTDIKFEVHNIQKLTTKIIEEYNKLSSWKKIKYIFKRKVSFKKCLRLFGKILKLPLNIILFFTGFYKVLDKHRITYHSFLMLIHFILAMSIPPVSAVFFLFAGFNFMCTGAYALQEYDNNDNNNNEEEDIDGDLEEIEREILRRSELTFEERVREAEQYIENFHNNF